MATLDVGRYPAGNLSCGGVAYSAMVGEFALLSHRLKPIAGQPRLLSAGLVGTPSIVQGELATVRTVAA